MGHSQADKAETHERIVQLAAKRFREAGIEGIGVADLMQQAGLTVGGFYKHFASREDLVLEAMLAAFTSRGKTMESISDFGTLLERYLSPKHRDDPGDGCPVSALASDAGRSSPRVRALYTEAVKRNIDQMTTLIDAEGPAEQRAFAILSLSALIGAVALARAVSDESLSLEILETVKHQLDRRGKKQHRKSSKSKRR